MIDNSAGVEVANISNPYAPTLVGQYSAEPGYQVLTGGVWNNLAFLGEWGNSGKVDIVDVSNPTQPTLLGTYSVPTYSSFADQPSAITVSGSYLFLGVFSANPADPTFKIIDISNPASPTLVGTFAGTESPTAIYVSGRYAYITDQDKGFFILDISNPALPLEIGHYAGSFDEVSVDGSYAYLTGANTFLELDVSNPAAPKLIGSTNIPNDVGIGEHIGLVGDYAYVPTSGGIEIIKNRSFDAAKSAAHRLAGHHLGQRR